jgi:arylsulfatase A
VNAKTGYARPAPAAWNTKHGYEPDDDSPVKLYDLKTDIGQRKNVAAEHPERVKAMQVALAKVRASRYPEVADQP